MQAKLSSWGECARSKALGFQALSSDCDFQLYNLATLSISFLISPVIKISAQMKGECPPPRQCRMNVTESSQPWPGHKNKLRAPAHHNGLSLCASAHGMPQFYIRLKANHKSNKRLIIKSNYYPLVACIVAYRTYHPFGCHSPLFY